MIDDAEAATIGLSVTDARLTSLVTDGKLVDVAGLSVAEKPAFSLSVLCTLQLAMTTRSCRSTK